MVTPDEIRQAMAAGGRRLVDRLDQEAERQRGLAAGDLVLVPLALAAPPVASVPVDGAELARQYWRWAAWACPNGIPPGWTESERP